MRLDKCSVFRAERRGHDVNIVPVSHQAACKPLGESGSTVDVRRKGVGRDDDFQRRVGSLNGCTLCRFVACQQILPNLGLFNCQLRVNLG